MSGLCGIISFDPAAPVKGISAMTDAAGWQGRRLHLLSSLVKAVPVRRLVYPNGVDLLPEVARAVADDVRRSVPTAA